MYVKSKGGTAVGSIGGLKIPPVDRYIAGFQFGAKKADPGIKTLNDYSQDFVAQSKCKEKALNQIATARPSSSRSPASAASASSTPRRSKNVFGIGVDADQGYLGAQVMTSALKKVDVAVHSAIIAAKGGKLKGGTNSIFGAKVNGVGLRQVEPAGARLDQDCGRGPVQAPQGRQGQGHPDDGQVATQVLDSGRGGPQGSPRSVSRAMR